jgi:hypothetical protein
MAKPSGSFLARHSKQVAALGGLFVLATFIVKDQLRDYFKGIADAESSAQSLYVIRKDLARIDAHVQALDDPIITGFHDTQDVCNFPPLAGVIAPSDEQGARQQLKVEKMAIAFHDLVSNLRDLSQSIPGEYLGPYDEVDKGLGYAKDEHGNIVRQGVPSALDVCGTGISVSRLEKISLERVRNANEEYAEFSSGSLLWGTVLYILGWGISFVGTLAGVQTGEKPE